jgi:hypothetical protein
MLSALGALLAPLRRATEIRSAGSAFVLLACAAPGLADTTRDYTENGIVYRETTKVTQRYVPEIKHVQQPQLQYREQIRTEMQTQQRTVQVPITEYVLETYEVNRWNPFAESYQAQRYVPRTRWETRTEQVQVPVVRREIIPEQHMVTVAVQSHRLVQDEVRTRVALGPAGSVAPQNTAIVAAPTTAPVGGNGTTWSSPPIVAPAPATSTAAAVASSTAPQSIASPAPSYTAQLPAGTRGRYGDATPTAPIYTATAPSDPFANYPKANTTELPSAKQWRGSAPTATRR